MILHGGVRTTEPIRVAYKPLEPGENEAVAITELLGELTRLPGFQYEMYDHSMVVTYDHHGSPDPRREILIPVPQNVSGVETKVFPSVRAAFLVFAGTGITMEEYYKNLWDYIKEAGLEPSGDIYSVEIMYVPEDLDNADYTMEIMIPLKG